MKLDVWSLLGFGALAHATSSNSTGWTNPNAQLPSFSNSFYNGETIIVSWISLNDSVNDLWLTRIDPITDDFALRLIGSLNLTATTRFNWQIAVDASEIELDTRFILQFLPAGSQYDPHAPLSLPSPAFNLLLVNEDMTPNGTVGAVLPTATTTTSNLMSGSSLSTGTSASSPTSSSQAEPPGYSDGSKAGMIVGAIGAFAVVGSCLTWAIFAVKRYRRRASSSTLGNSKPGPYEELGGSQPAFEMGTKDNAIHELNASKETIVSEAASSSIYEISSVRKQPGVHELPG